MLDELCATCYLLVYNHTHTLPCELDEYEKFVEFAMRDVEELFILPFGAVTAESITSGSGGQDGRTLVVLDGDKEKIRTFQEIHDASVKHLEGKETTDRLKALGMYIGRAKYDATVAIRWITNGRIYNLVDTGECG